MQIKSMKTKPIFWHQGLYLEPQHFQYNDLLQSTVNYTMHGIVSPFLWGVVNLSINEGALANEVIEIESALFIMESGTLIRFPSDSTISQRSFSSSWHDRNEPFTIFAGIKKLNRKGDNVTIVANEQEAQDIKTRFISSAESEPMKDFYQDGPNTEIKTLAYAMRLFWEDEIEDLPEYEVLPILQLTSDGDEIKLSSVFIPPCLQISSSSILMKNIIEIRDELAGRTRQLEEYKMPMGTAEPDVRKLPYRFALQLLSYYTPLLFHYIEILTVHPVQVYGVLRQLIGGLSTLSEDVNFLGGSGDENFIPPYKHNELGFCFSTVYGIIIRLLNEITVGNETIVNLEKVESNRFKAELPEDILGIKNDFFLVLRTETPFEELVTSFLNYSKIGSSAKTKILEERSLPGLSVKHLISRPDGLPARPNASYFRINEMDSPWEDIVSEKNIVLIWDDAPEDLKIELIGLRR